MSVHPVRMVDSNRRHQLWARMQRLAPHHTYTSTHVQHRHVYTTHTPHTHPGLPPISLYASGSSAVLLGGLLLPICPSPDTSTTSSYSQQRVISALILQEKIPKDQLCLTYLWGVCVFMCSVYIACGVCLCACVCGWCVCTVVNRCVTVWLVCVCLHVWVYALPCSELTAAPLENMPLVGTDTLPRGARVAASHFLTKEEAGSPQQGAPDVRMNSLS